MQPILMFLPPPKTLSKLRLIFFKDLLHIMMLYLIVQNVCLLYLDDESAELRTNYVLVNGENKLLILVVLFILLS